MDSKHKKTESTNLIKNSIITVAGLAVVGAGLWALMHYSTPPSNLESYANYQESQKKPEIKTNNPAEPKDLSKPQEIASPAETDLGNLVKTATSTPSPRSTLPRKTLEHIQKGMEFTEKGEYNAGNMEFEKASVLSPDSSDLYSIWGAALRMAKKYKGANKRFARAHELAPNDSEITFNWGMTQLEGDIPDDAIRLFQKTIDLDPNNLMAYNLLGKSYGRKKMYDQEVAAYKKAIEIEPNFALIHFNLGIVLGIQKKFETAAPHFLKAIELDKQYEKPFVIQMLTALGKYNPSAGKPINQPKPVKKEEKPEPVVKEAKATEVAPKEEKKEEGSASDHKMEGSKKVNETTHVKGKILINGKTPTPNTLVFLETKTKMRVKGQEKGQPITIHQNGLNFQPRHSIVQVGTSVTFSNHDKEVHNIYSKSQGNQFNLGAMASGSFKSIDFSTPGPIVLRCNMHKDMIGTIFVVPNGYFAQPNEKGEYEFKDVKSEGYIMQVWAPMLSPDEVANNIRSADLTGVDQTFDFDIKSASVPGEIHDMTDPTDYNAIVDNIEKEMYQAIEDWKNGKKFISRKRMLMAITKHFDGEGLKGAIAKSFSSKRSILLERKLDKIRKEISGYGKSEEPITEASLKSQAKFAVDALRNNVKELEARIQPTTVGH
ncbi:MAG: tetratricopeptide repeat protein [Nitrospina sp.]|jgi:tetratricopeptide (TPR) repeat protein|nr:tetratricopeptide repeat protein [Nitrospina sp.]MBT6716474.1 tetratricopeptide repeat protein [Nitrospina sp.]